MNKNINNLTLTRLNNLRTIVDYLSQVKSLINNNFEEKLYEKLINKRKLSKSIRKKSTNGIVEITGFIIPSDVIISSNKKIPIHLSTVSNPAISVENNKAFLYLRVSSTGSPFSRTFIAFSETRINDLTGRVYVRGIPLIYGLLPNESIEDPRVDPDNPLDVYHVRCFYSDRPASVITFRSRIGGNEIKEIEPVYFYSNELGDFLLKDYRDTFPLNNDFMTIRPFLKHRQIGFMIIAPRDRARVYIDEAYLPEPLLLSNDEVKIGGNASLKISSNEYLLLYHVVDQHGIYYTYGALFDTSGELIALTDNPIIVPKLGVYSGRRQSTVFVCGAAKVGDEIIITAGRDDEIVIIYKLSEEKLWSNLRFIR